jgi:hypothetical protein
VDALQSGVMPRDRFGNRARIARKAPGPIDPVSHHGGYLRMLRRGHAL